MKSIKTVVLALAITLSTVLSASANTTTEEPSVLSTEISALLKNPTFLISNDVLAKVTFVVNQKNEIVVISVDTDNNQLESYIKSKLNYSKLSSKQIIKNRTYVMPIRLRVK